MKIAVILNSFPEISEKFLLNFVVGLMDAGADVTVFAAHRPQTDLRHDAFARCNVESITRYVGVPRSFKTRVRSAPLLFLRLLLNNPKAAFEAVRVGKYRTVATNVKLLYFGNAFVKYRFDVVHCHFGVNGLIGAYLKESGMCSKLVATFHGSDINTYPKRHGETVYATLYSRADLITANTSFTKGKILANGCPEGLIKVMPVGLIAQEYANVDRSRISHGMILTVGRLEEKKGHRFLLEAMVSILKSVADARYVIAGGGSLEPSLRERAEELGIADRCDFLGVCSSEKVRELYATGAVFCLPSVTASSGDMEGQGLVLQEAQACGMPVVSTLHNGIPDGVLDGVSGYLVPEKDPEALSRRIVELLLNPEQRDRMGAAGREFVLAGYDVAGLTARLIRYYEELFSDGATPEGGTLSR